MTKRVMGKAAFFHLADESGQVQIYVKRDNLPEGFYNTVFKKLLDTGDWVGIEGVVFRTRMGEVSIEADRLTLLSKSLKPLPVEKTVTDEETGETKTFNEVSDPEFRYRQRYADLALHPEVRDVFKTRHRIVRTIQGFLDDLGYVEVETPALQPLYGGAAARPFTTHHNALDMPLFLRIADELYLKRLLVGGFEGVYEIAKDFRNEGPLAVPQPGVHHARALRRVPDYDWMMELGGAHVRGRGPGGDGLDRRASRRAHAELRRALPAAFPSSMPSRTRRARSSTATARSRRVTRSRTSRAASASRSTTRWARAS